MNATTIDIGATVAALLSRHPSAIHHEPCKLLEVAPTCQKLTGHRPAKAALHRWAAKGLGGVRLQCIKVGGCRYTTMAMLCRFFVEAGQTRTPAKGKAKPRKVRL